MLELAQRRLTDLTLAFMREDGSLDLSEMETVRDVYQIAQSTGMEPARVLEFVTGSQRPADSHNR